MLVKNMKIKVCKQKYLHGGAKFSARQLFRLLKSRQCQFDIEKIKTSEKRFEK